MKNKIFGLYILILCLVSCTDSTNKKGEDDLLEASLRFGWISSASFAGEVVGMEMFDEKNKLQLSCNEGGPGLNPITLVLSGEDTFGTIAADEVLAANEKGADLVIIGMINYHSPGGFIALRESGIKEPKDFEGRKVGILPFGSTTLIYQSLLEKNNVDRSSIEEITISPDLKPFLGKSYDVHPVFVYDETVTLENQGVLYNLIEPKNYGVSFRGPVYFCKRSTLVENPELVRSFIYTMADGWNYALENKKQAIALLKKNFESIDIERELQVLAKGAPYFKAYKGKPILSDHESWNQFIDQLTRLGVLQNSVDLENVLVFNYIEEYYRSIDES